MRSKRNPRKERNGTEEGRFTQQIPLPIVRSQRYTFTPSCINSVESCRSRVAMSSSPSSWSSISTPQSDASPQSTDTIQTTNTEMAQSPNSGYTLKQRKAGKMSNEIERKENGRRGEETKSSEGQIKEESELEIRRSRQHRHDIHLNKY